MSADAQLRLLTSGVVLPLAALHDAHLDVIADAVTGAWACLVASDPALARLGGETEVNAWLEIRLNQILDADPAFGALVASVTRGRESLNVSGSALEKRPDLSLLLTSRSPNFPFTVECKLLDRSAKKRVDKYCDKGVRRFVTGDYAWWAREAMMLAYVRDGSTLSGDLGPRLARDPATEGPLLVLPHPDAARSRHRRAFQYPSAAGRPGPISLVHLWLRVA